MTERLPCPGLRIHTPMRDGGLMRWRVPGGQLSSGELRAICRYAQSCRDSSAGAAPAGAAPAVIDLTSRANLQVRAVPTHPGPRVHQALRALEARREPGRGDRYRNVLLDPYSGLDPSETIDLSPFVAPCAAVLARHGQQHRISPKFSVVLDGGGRFGIASVRADITFQALSRWPALARIATAHARWLPVAVPIRDIPRATDALIKCRNYAAALVETHRPAHPVRAPCNAQDQRDAHHLCAWLRRHGVRARAHIPRDRDPEPPTSTLYTLATDRWGDAIVSCRLPPTPVHTDTWLDLARIADHWGRGVLRLAPARRVLIPHVRRAARHTVQAMVDSRVRPTTRREHARVTCCIGRYGCTRTTTDTAASALRLAGSPILPNRFGRPADRAPWPARRDIVHVHVVACPRRCGFTGAEDALVEFDAGSVGRAFARVAGLLGPRTPSSGSPPRPAPIAGWQLVLPPGPPAATPTPAQAAPA